MAAIDALFDQARRAMLVRGDTRPEVLRKVLGVNQGRATAILAQFRSAGLLGNANAQGRSPVLVTLTNGVQGPNPQAPASAPTRALPTAYHGCVCACHTTPRRFHWDDCCLP